MKISKVIKKILAFFVIWFVFTLITFPTFAAAEFTTSYNILYNVDPSGVTTVTQDITLKDLTEKYYASSFSLSIGATQISDVSAVDSQGPLVVTAKQEAKKTDITINFNQQVAGVGKLYPFKLIYKSKDFAQNIGKVWQVTIPKISSTGTGDTYKFSLQTPSAFGDPSSILPTPVATSKTADKNIYTFSKEQLVSGGILANFGEMQLFNFNSTYNLVNNSLLPGYQTIPLPPNTDYQQIILNSVSPKPENVTVDGDGNYIAQFKLFSHEHKTVNIQGEVKLTADRNSPLQPLSKSDQSTYTSSKPYWDTNSPQISSKLNDIFKDQHPTTNTDKAKLIYKYIVNYLQYDNTRLKNNDFSRLGAVTALNNPSKALCSEFSDLFVTLNRAAGIPSKELIGFAYTTNQDIRPLSFDKTLLHAWAEYYDPATGWKMVDPTWENTTGGVDYFSQFDLNHVVLAIRGVSSTDPTPSGQNDVTFTETPFQPAAKSNISIDTPVELYAGFPSTLTVKVENQGNTQMPSTKFTLSNKILELSGNKNFDTPVIPPFGFIFYTYDARSQSLLQTYNDTVHVQFGGQGFDKQITINPFFAHKYFTVLVIILVILITGFYIFTVMWHRKAPKNFHIKVHKESS